MPELKRLLDIAVSLAALMVLSPLMLLVAMAIWIESGRPLFFAQWRIGRDFRPFTLWKFRSMRPAAGSLVTASGDPRVTPLGKFLRLTKIDELPQFWNVLRGEMSLVGPRPEVPVYVDRYRAEFESILGVRPGITDLASIAFRNEEAVLASSLDPEATYIDLVLPAKLRLAQQYVRETSFWLDVRILFRTVLALCGHGGFGSPAPICRVKR